jgi:hypothetical protein
VKSEAVDKRGREGKHLHEHNGHAGAPHFHGHGGSILSRLWRRLIGRA